MAALNDVINCLVFQPDRPLGLLQEEPFFINDLPSGRFAFEVHGGGHASWFRIAFYIIRVVIASRPDAVVSFEYRRSFLVNMALLFAGLEAKHLIVGMNLSAKPIYSRVKLIQGVINRVFSRSTVVVVHSVHEARYFRVLHNFGKNRIIFRHWGFDLPSVDEAEFDSGVSPYFCMVGRNNRDLRTFARATKLAGVRGIAIVPRYMDIDGDTARTLSIFRDISFSDCVRCIRGAVANVTLLLDDKRGAGHITAVTAMHLGVRQIYSNCRALEDYFPEQYLGNPAPIGDALAVAEVMREMLISHRSCNFEADQEVILRKLFAKRWLSAGRFSKNIACVLVNIFEGSRSDFVDAEWAARTQCSLR